MVCTLHQPQTRKQHGQQSMADATHKARGLALVSLRLACDALQQANDELALRLLSDAVVDLRAAGVAEKEWEYFETKAPTE
jgi:hypothetical protein